MKSKTIANAICMILMFAMTFSLVALPAANAQDIEVRIRNYTELAVVNGDVRLRFEVRMGGSRIEHPWENVTLSVKSPGSSAWTIVGPFDVDDFDNRGRLYHDYTVTEIGTYQFMWTVPAQLELPPNPSTSDGSWNSDVSESEVVLKIVRKTFPVIGATPNPVGVGQEVLIAVGITQQLQSALDGWEGLSVTITRPDGTTEKISNIRTDSTGLTGRVYVPSTTGTYYLQTNFPEQIYQDVTYEASDSEKLELVVQADPIEFYPAAPLPNEYWTRPIDPQLREWSPVAGSWLVSTPNNYFAPYNDDAPDTAHVLWTTPLTSGGLVGGSLLYDSWDADDLDEYSEHSYEIGDAYEGKFRTRFIVGGKLYYDKYASPEESHEIVCVDLHTGEELWSRVFLDDRTISFCQLMYWDTYDYHGVYDYLWVTRGRDYYAFEAFNGEWVYTLENVPGGTRVYGPKGEILMYDIQTRAGYMTLWNSSNIPALKASPTQYGSMGWGQWRPYGKTIDATSPCIVTAETPFGISGYQWNVSIPTDLPGSVREVYAMDKAFGIDYDDEQVTSWAIDLSPGNEGQLLFKKTWNAPSKWKEDRLTISTGAYSSIDEIFTLRSKEDRLRYGFSMETGDFLWVTEPLGTLDHLMGGFAGESGAIAYGKFFSGTVSGTLKAFDVETGELAWSYDAYDPLSEILWSNNWPICYLFFTDGKAYIATTEHSPVDPRPRGGPFICLNATTGEVIWRVDGMFRQTVWGGRAIIGDSIIATMDTYDQRIYAIGKGPSATTVAIQNNVITHGSSVLVEGMVTDVSPGTNSAGLEMRFPNGVPAVSDANMSEWMLHVYKQFERPADAVGVEVVVSVLDPNNNFYEVGRATSDASGMFSCMFTPEVPGKYTVIASFAGSGAYYGSFAEAALGVEEAPAATPEPTPTQASASDLYLLPGIAGIIIAIAVVGAILMLMLRRR